VKISELFHIGRGTDLELNGLDQVAAPVGVNFVSRTDLNNGVSARVNAIDGVEQVPAGSITVSLGGSPLAAFLQPEPFYTGRDVAVLTPKDPMSDATKLYCCHCIRANRYRFNYNRQANRTLGQINLPDSAAPTAETANPLLKWVRFSSKPRQPGKVPELCAAAWSPFILGELFRIKKGRRLTKADQSDGKTRYIGAVESNNGVAALIGEAPIHRAATITVSYNGTIGEAFYQPVPYWCSDDVNALYPNNFTLTPAVGLFLSAVIRHEKYRYNYGRKWTMEAMQKTVVRLPSLNKAGALVPDFDFMERYIQALPFSSQL